MKSVITIKQNSMKLQLPTPDEELFFKIQSIKAMHEAEILAHEQLLVTNEKSRILMQMYT
jgi:hypothetical protein